jgi:hypothetical protein
MKITDVTLDGENAQLTTAAMKSLDVSPSATTPEYVNKGVIKRLGSPQWTPENLDNAQSLNTDYHKQALSQANAQFWFSVFAATIGFVWILYTGTEIKPDSFQTWAKIIPGVVMDTVAFLFFRQADATRHRATELLDRLRKDWQMAHAIDLASSISDVEIKDMVKAQLALHMAGLKSSPIDLQKYL